MKNKWWWVLVGFAVGFTVVTGVILKFQQPVMASAAVVAAPVVRSISFSDGTYIVGTQDGPDHSNVIGPGVYATDGTGGPHGLCMYRVIRNGQGVEGAMWGTNAGEIKTYSFKVEVGDQVVVALGCTVRSA